MKNKKTMDIILIFLGFTVYVFVSFMIWLYIVTGGVPDSLVYGFFAAVTGEAGFMGWIKTSKQNSQKREWDIEDRDFEVKKEEERELKGQEESNLILGDKNHQGIE